MGSPSLGRECWLWGSLTRIPFRPAPGPKFFSPRAGMLLAGVATVMLLCMVGGTSAGHEEGEEVPCEPPRFGSTLLMVNLASGESIHSPASKHRHGPPPQTERT